MANRIKESNITPGAVTSDKIAPGTVSASNISPGSITTTQIATDTIASSNIAPGTIANDRLANTGITINGTTIALGASGNIVAGTDWQAVVTADGSTATTASAGEGYFIDTTSNAHTVTLPSSPTQGDEVHIVDYAGTFGSNNVTVGRNGSNIDGTTSDGTLATNRLNVRFVYIDATQGWRAVFDDASASYGASYITATGGTVTESGDYKIHTFTGDSCFVVSAVGNPAGSDSVDYMVIAGGGGGAGTANPSTSDAGGGGGAGGFRESSGAASGCYTVSPLGSGVPALSVSATTYPVTVGGGGSAGGIGAAGTSGSNSVFSTITSTGGGFGQYNNVPSGGDRVGGSGGSGGGPSGGGTGMSGGAGNTPPTSPSQGFPGSSHSNSPDNYGGAGGGATAAGTDQSAPAGPGGAGATSSINATPTTRAGGGGGGGHAAAVGGNGGPGGGGTGGNGGGTGLAGTTNTGGGGGGGGGNGGPGGGAGGSGIVIIRYKFQ